MKIVVKIGTTSLCDNNGVLVDGFLEDYAVQLKMLKTLGHDPIVVSSGAVGAGIGCIGHFPDSTTEKQACAALGQVRLMQAYQRYLHPVAVGQVLLTREDIESGQRRENLLKTFNTLLQWGAVPLINENDSVADDEIKFGDNDTLAARVACLIGADQLILLSDVDGLYTADPRNDPSATKIPVVAWVEYDDIIRFGGAAGELGTGGMRTKLEAAWLAQQCMIPMVLASSGEPNVLVRIVQNTEIIGTHFLGKRTGDESVC